MLKKKLIIGMILPCLIFIGGTSCVKSEEKPSHETQKTANSQAPASEKAIPGLETDKKKLSYAMGMQIGESIKSMGAEIDLPTLCQAIET